jgi:Xaa-Pro aminopeptidase
MSSRLRGPAMLVAVALIWTASPAAQRLGYPAEEFTSRRARLARVLERGTVVMFAATAPGPGVRVRQDNDFFYLTGNESLNAVLVMDAATADAHLFLPRLTPGQIQFEGPNWLQEPGTAARRGFASVQPLQQLDAFLTRRRDEAGGSVVWARLSNRDTVNSGRTDVSLQAARRRSNPLTQYPSEEAQQAATVRERFPDAEVRDITPHLDRLRVIKSAREIEILRQVGRVSAEALQRAIQATAPGRFEYELEAEATHWMIRHGLQTAAYPAIVGSGPMGNQWHYEDNGRRMSAGELVVMDYGGSLDYLTVDITRTWPVSGQFTPTQRRAYDTVLETQKAIIATIRPGVTRAAVREVAERIFRQRGFDPRYADVGHYVGLSVHDVGDWSLPFEAGMVMAIEPIIDLPDQQMHVRVEDTILVTPTGADVLTAAVPKEVDALLALVPAR